ncbi:hypothetical protein G7072_05640 [Nocardioides sp. HDW12B]|uniref:hypothetical protein n=1 Tax=Nocardioides sp. HDW12B TaxID=2714939 RepID=UPI0014081100|nr:hypothetical protein [Nocardioides sp. HDW12B]QIK65885.1 hypothetical protein G7072_05640 [Nocardioides sp. HDW12B]
MVDLRHLLDDASLEDRPAIDPLEVVRVGRRRVRRRALVRGGVAAVLVLVVGAMAVTLRPWETDESRGLGPVAPVDPTPSPAPRPDRTPAATPPGTQLALGESAIVPVQHVGRGEAGLSVTDVRRGDRADILAVPGLAPSLRSSATRGEFWYVDVTVTYRSGRLGGYYLDPDVEPVLSGGRQLGSWSITDQVYAPCPARGLPLRPERGDSVKDCVIVQTTTGADVVGLRWGQFETAYDLAGGDPVTWREQRR